MGEDPSGNPAPLLVDNATGYLLIAVSGVTDVTPSVSPTDAARDDNRVPVMLGADQTTEEPSVLMIDNRSGHLWITQA